MAGAICFIACHGGPADHFATFAKGLREEGHRVEIYATGPAYEKLKGVEGVEPFSLETEEQEGRRAEELAEKCSWASVVITDVGHRFDISMQRALQNKSVVACAYYDNPEPYVSEEYSKVAAEVMGLAQKVLFANANFEKAPIYREKGVEVALKERIGIGYYPLQQAERVAKRRAEERARKREELGVQEGQKVLVYFGGNHRDYFERAFPAFLRCLGEGKEEWFVLLQQHPGAKRENLDVKQIGQANVRISPWNSEDALVVADVALYYQTSMGPLFALADVPAIQVGHETYEDLLIRGKLCRSVTKQEEFVEAVNAASPAPLEKGALYEGLGIREDWLKRMSEVAGIK